MLWFDNSKDSLQVKIEKAADYYFKKYGRKPDLVLVHPSMLENGKGGVNLPELQNITLRPYRPILPGHIWLGIEDKEPQPEDEPGRGV
jgi:hypothetical protein